VEVAFNGQEAFEMAVSEQFHLILMDISMPFMDGFEATSKIKANFEDNLPVRSQMTLRNLEENDKDSK
jgi:two-component system sensor histidine kinase/response regulator